MPFRQVSCKMAAIPGIGPKTAKTLWEALGVDDCRGAERRRRRRARADSAGFGAAKEKNILEAIERDRRLSERLPLYVAQPYAERLAAELSRRPEVVRAAAAGSLRRGRDTVGDIDLVAATTDSDATAAAVASLPGVTEVMESGPAEVVGMTDLGVALDVRLGKPEDFGALLHHFSSGRAHNLELRDFAESQGLKINEYGVFDAKTGAEKVCGERTRRRFTRALGLPYIAPELREGRGEIDLPAGTRSRNSLPKQIFAASFTGTRPGPTGRRPSGRWRKRPFSAATSTLRSPTTHAAFRWRTASRGSVCWPSWTRSPQLKEEFTGRGLTLLAGIEADILADGSLDADDDLLARLDIVVGSVHIRHKEDEAQMTPRVLIALANPHLDILGHPTGRLLGRREPFPIDMEAVFAGGGSHGNHSGDQRFPERMDLNDLLCPARKGKGASASRSTPTPTRRGLGLLSWGLRMARRAWLAPEDVINTYPLTQLPKGCSSGDEAKSGTSTRHRTYRRSRSNVVRILWSEFHQATCITSIMLRNADKIRHNRSVPDCQVRDS